MSFDYHEVNKYFLIFLLYYDAFLHSSLIIFIGCTKKWQALKMNSATGCYKLYKEELPWEDAEQKCQKEGAHLASITSDDEQTMLVQVFHLHHCCGDNQYFSHFKDYST